MGLADLILGKSNPFSQWTDSNPYAMPAIGAGIAGGTSLAGGIAGGTANYANAKQQNMAYQLAQQQLQLASQGANATADWLASQSNPSLQALAEPVRNRTISGADAMKMAFQPGQVVAPGSTVLPNPMGPSFGAPAPDANAQASAAPASGPPPAGPAAPLVPNANNPTPAAITGPQTAADFYQGFTGPQASASAPLAVAPNTQGIGAPAAVADTGAAPQGGIPPDTRAALMQGLAQAQGPALAPVQPTTSAPQPGGMPAPQAPMQAPAAYDPGKPFQVPATNPLQMTPQQRQSLADSQGLTGNARAAFIVSGRIPTQLAQSWRPLTDTEKTDYGIAATDPGRYEISSTGQVRPVGGTGSGGTNPADDANAQQIAEAIASGKQPPVTSGLYRLGGPVRAKLQSMGFDLTKATQDWTATSKLLATMNGAQQTRLRQAVNQVDETLPLVRSLADQWDAGKFPALNKAVLESAKQGLLGPDAASLATRLDAEIADITSELGTVYKGGNSSTDESLKLAATQLSSSWSAATLRDAIDLAQKNITYRKNSLQLGTAGIPNSQFNQMNPDGSGNAAAPLGVPTVQQLLDKYK